LSNTLILITGISTSRAVSEFWSGVGTNKHWPQFVNPNRRQAKHFGKLG
jgi:hypothetical protein